jgi:hypothetical protein
VDYYSDFFGNFADGENYPDGTGSLEVPDFDFVKKETWGYSLNGQQFLIPQGGSYSVVEDSFDGTTAKILAGANNSTTTDVTPYNTDGSGGPRAFSKSVNTGWVPTPGSELLLASDIFSLWGMTEIGSAKTDVYVLQLTYDERRVNGEHLGNGGYRLAAIDADGNWVNAVELNIGNQIRKFVKGPYDPSYGLGTYGIDMEAGVVWAVINYDADFAAVKF